MDLQQIHAAAEAECGYLNDADCIKIYVSSRRDSPAVVEVIASLQAEADKTGIKARTIAAGSCGYYDLEPMVTFDAPGKPSVFYHNVSPTTVSEILNGLSSQNALDISAMPLYTLQNRIALRNCGRIDPEDINQYILRSNGFSGLSRALHLKQDGVIQELKKSGLRGRGGAGFDTADKWQVCREAGNNEKYAVCNAVDADPQALTSRLLLESDPFSVLEGILIGAYAVGASHCFICINDEYTLGKQCLEKAMEQMRRYNLLGENILDSGFSCDIEIKEIPASLVSGEETALLCILEEKQAMPYIRTEYPAVSGLYKMPTLINNIETLACVSAIFQDTPELISGTGVEKSKGTKVVTFDGDIVHKYTVEVPFGMSLPALVNDIGGGVPGSRDIRAIQFGGPCGAYFAGDSLDIPVTYESLEDAGSIIGSGTITVHAEGTCTVEMARDAIAYLQAESCGKCVFCREGTYQMLDILSDIADNKGKPEDLDLLAKLAEGMRTGSICGLGINAANPVTSSIKLFQSDYDCHIKDKKCPAKKT
jgi:NADH-quinone oxidoreductase subunit F